MHRGQRKVEVFGDICRDARETRAGEDQVGPLRQGCQGRTHVRPGLDKHVLGFAPPPSHLREVPELAQEIGVPKAVLLIGPVGGRREAGRLDQRDQVGRHSQADVMSTPLQFAAHGRAGLDIAASSVARQGKFHDESFRWSCG